MVKLDFEKNKNILSQSQKKIGSLLLIATISRELVWLYNIKVKPLMPTTKSIETSSRNLNM